ncbi:MAG: cellulase [Acidobacteria bacterium]|nr:cellulase [Acidobacteriota bacterium]
MDGFWLQDRTGVVLPVYYVDEITLVGGTTPTPTTSVTVAVDAGLNRHAISPLIYGTAFATTAQLLDLNAPLNRQGGNNASRYNWQLNADNRGNDWYFESLPYDSALPGEQGDTFIQNSRLGNAQPMLTIPIIDWVAQLGANRTRLSSFSVAKYGAQTGTDSQWFPDAGNGVKTNGQNVTGNDKTDANTPNSTTLEQGYVQHLISRWGAANAGGLRYYILDNEHSIWFSTHRDVQPVGPTMDEIYTRMRDYGAMIKNQDPNATVVGPEEWGWSGYLYSGYDQWYAPTHNWTYPDRAAHGNMDYMPWLLQQFKNYEQTSGRRVLDVFTLHYYPQGGEFSDDASSAMQSRRNRSTRSLWDPNYTDETWVNDKVKLIPRMKSWVAQYYPNTPTGVTEYNWGAEGNINGATAQADVYGIFGREGLDLATRWTTPAATTPTYKAMKMYRNYDGQNHGFGDTSVGASVPNPDEVSAFAAVRSSDNALTVMVVNKIGSNVATTVNLANFASAGTAQVWQLTSANQITRLTDASVANNAINVTVPPQSVTLFVVGASVLASPTNLTAVRAANSIRLDWQDNTTDEDGFVVERAPGTTGNYVEIFRTGANRTNYRALLRYGTYSYRVKTLRAGVLSTPSNVVQVGR